MARQTNVDRYRAEAVQGQLASTNPLSTEIRTAGADVTVGYAVWFNTDGEYVNVGTGKPVGIAMWTRDTVIFQFPATASMIIPKGQAVTGMLDGDIFIKSSTNSTNGQKVFANNTTGVLSTGAAGATIAGSTETDYYVTATRTAGQVLKVSTTLEK